MSLLFQDIARFLAARNVTPPIPRSGAFNTNAGGSPQQYYNAFGRAYSGNEIVYAAIEMLATSAGEPHISGRKWRRESPRIGRTTGLTGDIRTDIRNEEQRMLARGLTRREVKEHMISNGFFKELPSHPLVTLLREPNPWMSRGQLWGTVTMDEALAGNAYLYKARYQDGPLKGSVAELWRLRPDRVKIIPSRMRFIEGFEYGVGGRSEDKVIIPPEDIVHFKTRNPFDDYHGMPPLMPVSGRVAIDDYMKNFLRVFYERGGAGPGSVLTVKQKLTEGAKDVIRDQFEGQFARASGPHRLMVLDQAETTYTPLSLNRGIRDALPKEIDAVSEARIAMAFGIPGSLLGLLIGYESSSYANKRQDWQVFWDLTMTPKLSNYDDVLNLQLTPEFGAIDEVLFDLSDIRALQEDVDKVQERHRKNVAAGLMSWEQGIEAIGLDPDTAKDGTFFIPVAINPTKGEDVPNVALPGAPEGATEGDGEETEPERPAQPEARLEIIAEVHCPKCGRWLGRNMNVGATAFCPTHKEVIVGQPAPLAIVKTVERDADGRIARVVEETA